MPFIPAPAVEAEPQAAQVTERSVVVVGGGPVGLWVASELALLGVQVTILEKRTHRSSNSRALGIHPRTLEILAMRGLTRTFSPAGRPVPQWHFGMLGSPLRFEDLPTPFPYMLAIPQATTERLLEDHARGLGVEILVGAEVLDLVQHSDHVHLSYSFGGGVSTVDAGWVVGCDGARSVVRELAGIAFHGDPTTAWGFLADVELDSPPRPGLRLHTSDGALVVAPLADGGFRVAGWDPRRQDPDDEVTLDDVRSVLLRVAGEDFGMRSPRWLSRFGNQNRLASTYRQGHVLLAGDAAHVHWPTGGLGLNAGLQDAMGLGWRLAAAVHDSRSSVLLDDYAKERRDYGLALRDSTLAQGALITAETPGDEALRELLEALIRSSEDVHDQLAGFLSGIALSYAPAADAHPLVGQRVPLRTTERSNDGAPVALFEHGSPVLVSDRPELREMLAPTSEGERIALELDPAEVLGPWARGLAAVLIRPDGYVAWALDRDAPLRIDQIALALQEVGIVVDRWSAEMAFDNMEYGQA